MAGSESENEEPLILYTTSIDPVAELEILEAYQYYEDKADGLGLEFERAVEACLASVERNPRMYAVVHREMRRAMLRRFPYGIFYLIEEQTIRVVGCFHASRDPKQWQRRA